MEKKVYLYSIAAAVSSPAESGGSVWTFQNATLHTELHSESRPSHSALSFTLLFIFLGNSKPANQTPPVLPSSSVRKFVLKPNAEKRRKARGQPTSLFSPSSLSLLFSAANFPVRQQNFSFSPFYLFIYLQLGATRCLFIWLLTPVTCTRPRGDEIAA